MDRLPRKLQNVTKLQQELKTRPEAYWNARGRKMALNLFHEAAERVPAYKDFLAKNKIDHKKIRTIKDFATVPPVDKDNYLRKYSRKDLCWDGKFAEKQWVISTTSGSTGEPFYFPRTDLQDEYYALTAELYLRENFDIQNKTTLYIDAFAMGAWIGGLFTYEAIKRVADKGYALSIITPGIHKKEIINIVSKVGHEFEQVIIGCYPPMMKDILDLGIEEGLEWSSYNLGLIFSAEGFGENFRDHVHEIGGVADIFRGSLNHFGTVDQGTLSHETPTAILIRRQAQTKSKLFRDLFGAGRKTPTLTQYIPELFYFESVQNRIICTSNSGFPLVRYDLKDSGGVLSNKKIESSFNRQNIKLSSLLDKYKINTNRWNLPYVYVTERDDFSVKLAGGMIYAEEIKKALSDKNIFNRITGRFTMEVVLSKKIQPKLVVHIELRKSPIEDKTLAKNIQNSIVKTLLDENSEFVSNYKYYGRKLYPRVVLWSYEHHLHFSGQGKQKWVKK